MKVRTLLSGAIAVALLAAGGVATTAKAEDPPPVDADVYGGVAGIQAVVTVGGSVVNSLFDKDYAEYSFVAPRVALPANGAGGNPYAAYAVKQTVGPVKVKALFEKISGYRTGLPYFAAGESHLAGINISGTNISALDVTCLWDRDGGSGSTTVTDLAGNKNKPAPNEPAQDIAGLGTLRFNEQYTTNVSYFDPALNTYRYTQTIYVFGAHLHLSQAAADNYGVVDVILGFTSCDPTLPNLSGLKLVSVPSD